MNAALITQILTVYTSLKGQLGDKKTETIILGIVGADLLLRFLNG